MEFAKSELNVIEEAIQEAARNDIRELNDLQLALVGGGIGDVILASTLGESNLPGASHMEFAKSELNKIDEAIPGSRPEPHSRAQRPPAGPRRWRNRRRDLSLDSSRS